MTSVLPQRYRRRNIMLNYHVFVGSLNFRFTDPLFRTLAAILKEEFLRVGQAFAFSGIRLSTEHRGT